MHPSASANQRSQLLLRDDDRRDVVPLDLAILAVRTDRDTEVDFHAAEDLIRIIRAERPQVEVRRETCQQFLRTASLLAGEGCPIAQGALLGLAVLVLDIELAGEGEHGIACRAQPVLDRLDVAGVGALRDELSRGSLDVSEVDDLGKVFVALLVVVVAVSVERGCWSLFVLGRVRDDCRRCSAGRRGCRCPASLRAGCCGTAGRSRAAAAGSVHCCH